MTDEDRDIQHLHTSAREAHEAGALQERDALIDLAATLVMEFGDPGGHPSQREDGWLLGVLEEQAGPLSDYLKDPDDEDPFDEAWVREEAKE